MKIIDPRREHQPFDIAAGQWPLYKSQGYHQFQEIPTEPEVTVTWRVQRGRFINDYECPPLITYFTSNGTKGYCESTQGTAHKTVKVYVPGQRPHTCPEHVGEEYVRLFNQWASKSKKYKQVPVEKVSASTPMNILQEQGVRVNAKGASWDGVIGSSPWRREVETRNK